MELYRAAVEASAASNGSVEADSGSRETLEGVAIGCSKLGDEDLTSLGGGVFGGDDPRCEGPSESDGSCTAEGSSAESAADEVVCTETSEVSDVAEVGVAGSTMNEGGFCSTRGEG